jgi:hypothetical protein
MATNGSTTPMTMNTLADTTAKTHCQL